MRSLDDIYGEPVSGPSRWGNAPDPADLAAFNTGVARARAAYREGNKPSTADNPYRHCVNYDRCHKRTRRDDRLCIKCRSDQ